MNGATSYAVVWREPGGEQKSRTFTDKDKPTKLRDFHTAHGNSLRSPPVLRVAARGPVDPGARDPVGARTRGHSGSEPSHGQASSA